MNNETLYYVGIALSIITFSYTLRAQMSDAMDARTNTQLLITLIIAYSASLAKLPKSYNGGSMREKILFLCTSTLEWLAIIFGILAYRNINRSAYLIAVIVGFVGALVPVYCVTKLLRTPEMAKR